MIHAILEAKTFYKAKKPKLQKNAKSSNFLDMQKPKVACFSQKTPLQKIEFHFSFCFCWIHRQGVNLKDKKAQSSNLLSCPFVNLKNIISDIFQQKADLVKELKPVLWY